MPIEVEGRTIERVALVDDAPDVRRSYTWTVEDANLEPVSEDGPLESLAESVDIIATNTDVAVCDHHLRVSDYAQFDGAELVAALYDRGFPAILCTKWDEAQMDFIRGYRDRIPVLLSPENLDPDSLVEGMTTCIRELTHGYGPTRKPWRTQVHVLQVDPKEGVFFVELPSWSRDQVVKLRLEAVPGDVRGTLESGRRLHASVNAEAESQYELYFRDWELE